MMKSSAEAEGLSKTPTQAEIEQAVTCFVEGYRALLLLLVRLVREDVSGGPQ